VCPRFHFTFRLYVCPSLYFFLSTHIFSLFVITRAVSLNPSGCRPEHKCKNYHLRLFFLFFREVTFPLSLCYRISIQGRPYPSTNRSTTCLRSYYLLSFPCSQFPPIFPALFEFHFCTIVFPFLSLSGRTPPLFYPLVSPFSPTLPIFGAGIEPVLWSYEAPLHPILELFCIQYFFLYNGLIPGVGGIGYFRPSPSLPVRLAIAPPPSFSLPHPGSPSPST